MITAAIQMFVTGLLAVIGTYGTYVPGDTKDSVLFFHFTEDHWIAVAELDASKTAVRSDTRLFAAPEMSNLVRAARGADGIHVVVGRHLGSDEPVMLAKVAGQKLVAPPIEIGHGSDPDVAASAESKYVVTTFFETRPTNEGMRGRDLGPPTHVVHVQAREPSTLALAGARTFRDRDGRLLDDSVVMAPGIVLDIVKVRGPGRIVLDLPARGHRRTVVAQLPLIQVVDDRLGPPMGDRPGDADASVSRIDEPEEP